MALSRPVRRVVLRAQGGGNAWHALGEDMAFAMGIVAEQAPDLQADEDGIRAPRQVGECPLIAAMDALGPFAAKRAGQAALPRVEG
jgi:hypothetical protein